MPPATTVVVHPCDETSLRGACEAAELGIIKPILVGPVAKITAVAKQHGIDIARYELVDVPHSDAAAAKAVELIHEGKGELLMKGSLHTDELMRAVTSGTRACAPRGASVTSSSWTCRPIRRRFSSPMRPSTSFPISRPSATSCRTRSICSRRSAWARRGSRILSAVETVTPKIPSTIDAAALCKMADRGQITGGVLDGPLAFDNAISPQAAEIKGIKSPVAGRAQILVVPDLEAGNMLAKNLTFLSKADAAGIVLGARVPIILTSRADSVRSRLASCAVAVLYAHARRKNAPLPAA